MEKISLKNIKKNYMLGKNIVPALTGLSLEINEGEFLAIAGSSGSGKTTLLNIIGCIDYPTEGEYLWDDQALDLYNDRLMTSMRKNQIGYIFQTFNLIPVLSTFENVDYPLLLEGKLSKKERKERVAYYLNKVGLFEKRKHRPAELSGGQRQRVAIARALVKEPEIILADEPTANLDSKTGISIIDLMKSLNQEKKTTFIFSSHDHIVIEHARRIVSICDGKVIKKEK